MSLTHSMHICFLCGEYPPGQHGGIGSKIQVLSRALVERGHRVTVLGVYRPGREGVENDRGVQVVRLRNTPIPRTGFLVNSYRVRRALAAIHREHPVDLIDGPELSLAPVPGSFGAAKVIRMSGGHHFFAVTLGRKPAPLRSWLEKRSFAHADFLCGVSRYVAETTRKLLRLGDWPIEILPNPSDVALFAPLAQPAGEPGLIVFAGTVCEKKGVRQLVEAMPRIVAAAPHARLWLVGRDSIDPRTGGSYVEGLRAAIDPAVRDRVEIKGPIEHHLMPEVFARAELCVFPSHMEAMGNVIVEAMAMQKAVVSSTTGPIPEVVEDGVSGILCNPFEPRSIADAVITLLQNADQRKRLALAARQRAVTLFSAEALIERNEVFFRRCVREMRYV